MQRPLILSNDGSWKPLLKGWLELEGSQDDHPNGWVPTAWSRDPKSFGAWGANPDLPQRQWDGVKSLQGKSVALNHVRPPGEIHLSWTLAFRERTI